MKGLMTIGASEEVQETISHYFCELILNEGDVDVIMFESFGVIQEIPHCES